MRTQPEGRKKRSESKMSEISDRKKTEKQDGVLLSDTQLSDEEREVLSFLAKTKRVDVRWLGEEQKQRIGKVLDELHNTKKLSLLQISSTLGKSYTKIWGLCRALQVHTRTVAEADSNSAVLRSKHQRKAFDGTEEDKAYMTEGCA